MGAFGKKDSCVICGGKLPALTSIVLADGKMCRKCWERCTQYVVFPQRFTSGDIKRNMEEAIGNKRLYQIFSPREFPYLLHIDYINRLFAVAPKKLLKSQKAYIFSFDEILDYEVFQDGNTISKSGVGGAIVGGILFGGAGLVVGGLMGRGTKETITKMSINLKTTNEWAPTVEISILSSEVKKDSATYRLTKLNTETLLQAIDSMMQKSSQ